MNINCNCVRTDKGDLTLLNGEAVLLDKPIPVDIKLLVIDDEELFSMLNHDAFWGYLSVEKIVLTNNIKRIPDHAFAHYSFLRTITLPKTLHSIGRFAFRNCDRLHRIVIPEGVEKIESGAFCQCIGLREVYLPDSVSEIGTSAFMGCTSLERIHGGRGVKKINDLAFAYSSIRSLHFGDALCECGCNAFIKSQYIYSKKIFFCNDSFGNIVNDNSEFVIGENIRVLEDCSVDFGGAKSVVLPESVRNISRYAFVSPNKKDLTCDDELIKLLPKEMNKPSDFFIRNALHDYVMSFLLADTVWKDQVTQSDLVNIYLYHNNEKARMEARRRLCKEHDSVIYEMLSIIAYAPEKISLIERMGEYVAAYLSDFSEYALEYFYKRAKKLGAHRAIDTVVKQCFALLNIMPEEKENLFGTDGLEPFFAKEFFDALTRSTGCVLQKLYSVRLRDYAPDWLIMSILYAYTKQVTTNVSDIIEVPHDLDIHVCVEADEAAALLGEDSFIRFVDSLDSTAHGGLFLPFVCHFGSERKIIEVINKCMPEFNDILLASLEISETDQARLFLTDYYYGLSAKRKEDFEEVDEYDESEYELGDAEDFGGDDGELDEEEYDYCIDKPIAQESEPIEIRSVSFESAIAEFGVPQSKEKNTEVEKDIVHGEYNEGEQYRLLGEDEEQEELDAAEQEQVFFEDKRYRFLAVEEDCKYLDSIDLDDYDLDEDMFDELCMEVTEREM